MKFLLDTHVLLWAAVGDSKLPATAAALIVDPVSELFFSVASIWEVAIKTARQRADFSVDAMLLRRQLLDNDYHELPINGVHVVAITSLPALHRDPFDRILVAQATAEGITLLTADAAIAQYPGPMKLV